MAPAMVKKSHSAFNVSASLAATTRGFVCRRLV